MLKKGLQKGGEHQDATIESDKNGPPVGVDRRDFLRKAGVGGAAALAWLSQACKPGPDKESGVSEVKEVMDPGVAIIVEEFTKFCEKGVTASSPEELRKVGESLTQCIESIKKRIGDIDPSAFKDGATEVQIREYMMEKGFYFNISKNPLRDRKDKTKVHQSIFVGVHRIEGTEDTTPQGYFPEYLPEFFEEYPDIPAITVGDNMITNFEPAIKRATGWNLATIGTQKDGRIIFFSDGSRQYQKEQKLSAQEVRQKVVSNEMGHIIFRHIFGDFPFNAYPNLKLNGKYSPLQVNEALSDISMLKHGAKTERVIPYSVK